MEENSAQKGPELFLSEADPGLLKSRLPGGEFLLNHMLGHARDEELPATIYLLHDWVLANKAQFSSLAKYIDQPKERVDEAIDLFVQNHQDICTPADLKPGEYPLLPLYLLYDCFLHVGAIAHNERGVGYLSGKFNETKWIDTDEFLEYATSGTVYNYARIDGHIKIAGKHYYHSEIADGKPLQGAGEISLTRDSDGCVVKIRVNFFTGHYRVTDDTMGAVANDIEQALAKRRATAHGPARLFLTENSLGKTKI